VAKPKTIYPASIRDNFINILVYGIPGIGKTYLAGTSPRCLILECGTGETTTNVSAGQKVDVWQILSRTELTDAHEYLRHEGHDDYDWVWLDGWSTLDSRLMQEQMQMVGGMTTGSGKTKSELVPDKPDYLKVQSIISNFAQWFVDLPINFGATAHVMLEDTKSFDEDGDQVAEPMMMPQIQGGRGKMSQKVAAMVDIVAYMDTVTVKTQADEEDTKEVRSLLIVGDGRHLARSRYGALDSRHGWLLNPTIPKITAEIVKGKNKPTKKVAKKAVKAPIKKSANSASKAAGLRTRR
jgi:hypothetical protein